MVPINPRRKALRPYSCFKKRFPSTGAVNSPKPMAAKAIRHIFKVRIFRIRANAASRDGGTGCVSPTTCPSTSSFSC